MAEKQTAEPEKTALPAKKRSALLKYLSILFAGAFLLVALSLLLKLHAMQNDMDALDSGARENILALEDEMETERSENAALQTELDGAVRSAKAAELLALAQNALLDGDAVSFHGYMAELDGYADALTEKTFAIYNDLLEELPQPATR